PRTYIYPLSLHDALPISRTALADLHRIALTTGERTRIVDNTGDVLTWMTDDDGVVRARIRREAPGARVLERVRPDSARWESLFTDRKSTRLNSSHDQISY